MISGLLKPDAGEVLVAGHAFWSNPQQAKRIMAVVRLFRVWALRIQRLTRPRLVASFTPQ